MIVIKTSKGDIGLQLHDDVTPITTANFLAYVRDGFYNDTIFHRVIDKFMIQGGGLTADMETKKAQPPIENEAKVAKANKRGTISMARTAHPNSATAQFFINLVDNDFLNYAGEHQYGYCVFGEVAEGMDIVDAIAKLKTGQDNGHSDVPLEIVTIYAIEER